MIARMRNHEPQPSAWSIVDVPDFVQDRPCGGAAGVFVACLGIGLLVAVVVVIEVLKR